MAVVYLARQIGLDRQVALKELRLLQAPDDPALAARFLREARVVGSLGHPNIVTVHEYFEHEGIPYIAMEFLRRGSLRPWVNRLSVAQAAGVLEGLLAALDHAEQYDIVHRDLKPENLLVTDQGQVKVADFGIAKARTLSANATNLTAAGTTVGTPTYMAPEQAMAADIGPYTDLYSVGVMAYEMLVGQAPFADTDAPMAVMLRHINEPIPPAHTVNPAVDPALSDWVDRLLVKEPEGRVQSAEAAWDELEDIVLALLGYRWRREARLVGTGEQPAAKPLTPAPFTSTGVDTPAPEEAAPGFRTFGPAEPTDPATPLASGSPSPAEAAPAPAAAAPSPDGPPPAAPAPSSPAPSGPPPLAPVGPSPSDPREPARTPLAPTRAVPAAARADRPPSRRAALLAVPLLLVVIVAVLLVSGVLGGGDESPSGGAGAPAKASSVTATIDVGDGPDGIAVGDGAVFVANSGDGKLTRIDPGSGKVTGTADASPEPDSLDAEQGDVFVTAQGDEDRLLRFAGKTTPDPAGGRDLGAKPDDVEIDGDTIWVVLIGSDSVQRVDFESNSLIDEPIPVGHAPVGVDVGDGRVWVANSQDGTVSRIDAASGEPLGSPVPVGNGPHDVTLGDGFAWVVLTDDDAVVRLDPSTGKVVGNPIRVGDEPHKVAVGEGAVWVTNTADGTVSEIDPTTFRVVGKPIPVGDGPLGIAAGEGSVWVSDHDGGTVTQIDPGTKLATGK